MAFECVFDVLNLIAHQQSFTDIDIGSDACEAIYWQMHKEKFQKFHFQFFSFTKKGKKKL